MKRGWQHTAGLKQEASNAPSTTPKLCNIPRAPPARSGKRKKQTTLTAFLTTETHAETPATSPGHKPSLRTQSCEWPSTAQKAFESFRLGTPTAEGHAPLATSESTPASKHAVISSTHSIHSCSRSCDDAGDDNDDFKLFSSQTYLRLSSQQDDDGRQCASDDDDDVGLGPRLSFRTSHPSTTCGPRVSSASTRQLSNTEVLSSQRDTQPDSLYLWGQDLGAASQQQHMQASQDPSTSLTFLPQQASSWAATGSQWPPTQSASLGALLPPSQSVLRPGPSDCSQAWTHQASSQDEQEWETVSTQPLTDQPSGQELLQPSIHPAQGCTPTLAGQSNCLFSMGAFYAGAHGIASVAALKGKGGAGPGGPETCAHANILDMLAELGSSGHAVKTPELVAVAHCEGGQGDRPPSGLGKQPARLFDIFRPKTQRKMLIIVRHGESEYNKAVLESKHYSDPLIFDPRLTQKGLVQCKELQQKLATILAEKRQEFGEPLWVVSPLTRALQTFMEACPSQERLAAMLPVPRLPAAAPVPCPCPAPSAPHPSCSCTHSPAAQQCTDSDCGTPAFLNPAPSLSAGLTGLSRQTPCLSAMLEDGQERSPSLAPDLPPADSVTPSLPDAQQPTTSHDSPVGRARQCRVSAAGSTTQQDTGRPGSRGGSEAGCPPWGLRPASDAGSSFSSSSLASAPSFSSMPLAKLVGARAGSGSLKSLAPGCIGLLASGLIRQGSCNDSCQASLTHNPRTSPSVGGRPTGGARRFSCGSLPPPGSAPSFSSPLPLASPPCPAACWANPQLDSCQGQDQNEAPAQVSRCRVAQQVFGAALPAAQQCPGRIKPPASAAHCQQQKLDSYFQHQPGNQGMMREQGAGPRAGQLQQACTTHAAGRQRPPLLTHKPGTATSLGAGEATGSTLQAASAAAAGLPSSTSRAGSQGAQGAGQGGQCLVEQGPAGPPLQVEVLPCIAEFLVTAGDVGRPASVLSQEFPQLSHQLAKLPEQWWYQGAGKPNCALTKCMEGGEPVINQKGRIAEFTRWLNGRPESLFVLIGHGSYWYNFMGKQKRMHNCEVIQMSW